MVCLPTFVPRNKPEHYLSFVIAKRPVGLGVDRMSKSRTRLLSRMSYGRLWQDRLIDVTAMSAKASGKELMTQPLLFGDRENICPECGGGLHLCGYPCELLLS